MWPISRFLSWKGMGNLLNMSDANLAILDILTKHKNFQRKIEERELYNKLYENINNHKFRNFRYDKEENEIILSSGKYEFNLTPNEFSELLYKRVENLDIEISILEKELRVINAKLK